MTFVSRAAFAAAALCLSVGLSAAAVPSKPIKIISPPTGKIDNLFEAIATPNGGFLVSFARSVGSLPPFTLYTQRFTSKGARIGGPVRIDGPGIVGDHVEMARLTSSTAVAVWDGGVAGVKAGRLNLTTGVVSSVKSIGPSDDHIHDVAVLSGGNVAVVTPTLRSFPLPIRYKINLKILNQSLGTVRDWQTVNGAGFELGFLDPNTYINQTVVGLGTGGMVLYRDPKANRVVGRRFSAGGTLGAAVTLNTTALGTHFATDVAYSEVKAARLTDGRAAACWTIVAPFVGKRYDVRCRVIGATGVPIGRDFRVTPTSTGDQYGPEVVALPNGRFTVTWVDVAVITPTFKYRSYTSGGTALTGVRTGHASAEVYPFPPQSETARLADGSIVNVISAGLGFYGVKAFGIANPLK